MPQCWHFQPGLSIWSLNAPNCADAAPLVSTTKIGPSQRTLLLFNSSVPGGPVCDFQNATIASCVKFFLQIPKLEFLLIIYYLFRDLAHHVLVSSRCEIYEGFYLSDFISGMEIASWEVCLA